MFEILLSSGVAAAAVLGGYALHQKFAYGSHHTVKLLVPITAGFLLGVVAFSLFPKASELSNSREIFIWILGDVFMDLHPEKNVNLVSYGERDLGFGGWGEHGGRGAGSGGGTGGFGATPLASSSFTRSASRSISRLWIRCRTRSGATPALSKVVCTLLHIFSALDGLSHSHRSDTISESFCVTMVSRCS